MCTSDLQSDNQSESNQKNPPLLTGSMHEYANVGWNNQDFSTHYSRISSKSIAIQMLMVCVLSNGMAEQPRLKKGNPQGIQKDKPSRFKTRLPIRSAFHVGKVFVLYLFNRHRQTFLL